MFTDSHCHLASGRFGNEERAELIRRAAEAGIHRSVTLATCLDDIDANLEIASHPAVQAAVGIHPCDVHQAPDDAAQKIQTILADPRVAAVGETGLDYYHSAPDGWSDEDFRERQKRFLREHFEIAQASQLNIVLHTRDQRDDQSFQDAFEIYQDFRADVRAVFHCWVGTLENAKRVLDAGGLLSFGGVSTFKKSQSIREIIQWCPQESFMLETDSPYLAPDPHRGKRNEPAFVSYIAKIVAECRSESLDELSEHTEKAVSSFFRWNDCSL